LFEDYTSDQLNTLLKTCASKNEYVLDDKAKDYAINHFINLYELRDDNFGNARDVRNFLRMPSPSTPIAFLHRNTYEEDL
jgi:hypothetical protein